jgi:hypothetical protein
MSTAIPICKLEKAATRPPKLMKLKVEILSYLPTTVAND